MKRAILFLVPGLFVGVHLGFSQSTNPPSIQWQRSFGGSGSDEAVCIRQTAEGGYVVAGNSTSGQDGNKESFNYGSYDFWLLRLDSTGNKLWDRTFGGAGFDYLGSQGLYQTTDGGFVLGGRTYSAQGTGNKTSPSFGGADFWVVRLDTNGGLIWDKSFGSTSDEWLSSLQQTADDGFILTGTTSYADSYPEWWILRLDAAGSRLWEKTFGGESMEQHPIIRQTPDGGFFVGGTSSTALDGSNLMTHFGGEDFRVICLDTNGNILWEKFFGGSSSEYLYSLQLTADGGVILGGSSDSPPDGNKTSPYFGMVDFWIVRLDADGNRLWDRSFGGSGLEFLGEVQPTADGGFIAVGSSSSGADGNKTSPFLGGDFNGDAWVVRLDADGNRLWDQSYGGSADDRAYSVQETSDGGYIIGAFSGSGVEGNKTTGSYGGSDIWVIKLGPDAPPGRPRLRLPAQTADDLRATGCRLYVSGPSNRTCVVEHSADLITWTPFQTNQLSSVELEITDTGAANATKRFYRARLDP